MACWRLDKVMLLARLLLLSGTVAHPLFPTNDRQLAARPLSGITSIRQGPQSLAARVTQDGQPDTTIDDHGGFSVASLVGIAVAAAFTLAVISSLSYSAYYRHAKLKLHRQFLERLGPLPSQAQAHQTEASGEATIPGILQRTRTITDLYGLVPMVSPSTPPPQNIYPALQEEQQLNSPVITQEAKTKTAEEDKVLGRREDIIPLGRQFVHAARDGQMLAIIRPAF